MPWRTHSIACPIREGMPSASPYWVAAFCVAMKVGKEPQRNHSLPGHAARHSPGVGRCWKTRPRPRLAGSTGRQRNLAIHAPASYRLMALAGPSAAVERPRPSRTSRFVQAQRTRPFWEVWWLAGFPNLNAITLSWED
jgi:hypothetical protein